MSDHQSNMDIRGWIGGYLPQKIYVFLIMMKYDDLYFAIRYNFLTDCVEWYFLPKTDIKVFLKKYGYTWFWLVNIDMAIDIDF